MTAGKKKYDWKADLKKVRQFAAEGLTEEQIYHCLGISHETFYKYKRIEPEYADAIKQGQSEGIQLVSNALFKSAMKGNTVAQIFYLKNRSKKQWKDNPDIADEQNAKEIAEQIVKSLPKMDILTKGKDKAPDELNREVVKSGSSETDT